MGYPWPGLQIARPRAGRRCKAIKQSFWKASGSLWEPLQASGSLWKACGKLLGASGKPLGSLCEVWEASGKPLGRLWKACGKLLGAFGNRNQTHELNSKYFDSSSLEGYKTQSGNTAIRKRMVMLFASANRVIRPSSIFLGIARDLHISGNRL